MAEQFREEAGHPPVKARFLAEQVFRRMYLLDEGRGEWVARRLVRFGRGSVRNVFQKLEEKERIMGRRQGSRPDERTEAIRSAVKALLESGRRNSARDRASIYTIVHSALAQLTSEEKDALLPEILHKHGLRLNTATVAVQPKEGGQP